MHDACVTKVLSCSYSQVISIGGHKVRAMRLSFIGELGWEIHAPNAAALDVYHALFKAGKDFGLKNSGYRAMDSLSMEKGELCDDCADCADHKQCGVLQNLLSQGSI